MDRKLKVVTAAVADASWWTLRQVTTRLPGR